MDLQLLSKTEGLLERAAQVGVTVELLDDGKLRMRRQDVGPRSDAAAERLRACRGALVVVLAIPRPSAEQELLRDEGGWIYLRSAIGPCVVCDEPCRSWDPDDRPRHPTCNWAAR